MASKHLFYGGLFYFAVALPVSAHSAVCIVSGPTKIDAARQYAKNCALPIKDCDPVGGQWYCSSEKIRSNSVHSIQQTVPDPDRQSFNNPVDQITSRSTEGSLSCIDPDGDGWGWDGASSCQVAVQGNDINSTFSVSVPAVQLTPSRCVDDDGDGWGWNGSGSCQVGESASTASATQQFQSNIQSDVQCTGSYDPSDITDLVLVTGQSNVTGAETSVAATLDRWGKVTSFRAPDQPHPRVFAWTVDPGNSNAGTGWQVASLNQSWHDSAPGVGGIARNNFAFHFAKRVAESDGCRVVGFVMVSEGGKGIAHWDNNRQGWNEVVRQITEAMTAIGRSSIDGILWHQGESDWISDGTCFGDDHCRNNQPDYYAQKLYSKITDHTVPNTVGGSALIDRLRRESWFGEGKPFIAGETLQAPVNVHLNKLNTDSDRWTACVSSDKYSGLGVRENDPFKNHYSASGLRELGARYASEYLQMTN